MAVKKKRKPFRKIMIRKVKAKKNPGSKKPSYRTKGKKLRPRMYKYSGKFFRSDGKGAAIPQGTKIMNPKRKRKVRRNAPKTYNRSYTRTYGNPKRKINIAGIFRDMFSKTRIMNAASIGGGIVTGFMAKPLILKIVPQNIKDQAWFSKFGIGILHIIAGGLVATLARKNQNARNFAIAISGTGVYELIAQNTEIGLIPIPDSNALSSALGASYEFGSKSTLGASYLTDRRPTSPVTGGYGLGATVPAYMGASYESPLMKTAGLYGDTEDPFEGVSWG